MAEAIEPVGRQCIVRDAVAGHDVLAVLIDLSRAAAGMTSIVAAGCVTAAS
jgi:hypothetical protein